MKLQKTKALDKQTQTKGHLLYFLLGLILDIMVHGAGVTVGSSL